MSAASDAEDPRDPRGPVLLDPNPDDPEQLPVTVADEGGIRCPLCGYRPRRADRWMCGPMGPPENFRGGCRTVWNTFDTAGRCPTCHHQYRYTSCPRCWSVSAHRDWYASSGSDSAR